MVNKLEAILDIIPRVNGVELNKAMKQTQASMKELQKREAGPGRRVVKRSQKYRDAVQQAMDVGQAASDVRGGRAELRKKVAKWNSRGESGFGAAFGRIEAQGKDQFAKGSAFGAFGKMEDTIEKTKRQDMRKTAADYKKVQEEQIAINQRVADEQKAYKAAAANMEKQYLTEEKAANKEREAFDKALAQSKITVQKERIAKQKAEEKQYTDYQKAVAKQVAINEKTANKEREKFETALAKSRITIQKQNVIDQKNAEREKVAAAKAALKERENEEKAAARRVADIAKKNSEQIKNAFSAAFSLHIITQFVSPFINKVQQMMRQTITVFAEFDKYYADYLAKSKDFASTLSRSDIFALQAGQAYGINDVAAAMERFSASGIDVSKNTKAVTDILQLATVAQVDYKDASNAVIKTMEAFHLTASKSTMIVDTMTAAANASTAELEDMVEWFEYAAGSAYTAGLEVKDLSAYLGILSSAGLKNVGTSFRQFLVQFQKADVREKFGAKFGLAAEDFRDMNKVISTMRNYVQNSGDATAAAEELTQMLGGKVNAMQALQQLLLAQPALWNRLQTAVNETGVTSELYADATNNAAHSIERIQNTIESFYAQIGFAFAPILKGLADVLGYISEALSAMPAPFKVFAGVLVVASGALSILAMGMVTIISLMAVMQGATGLFMGEQFNLSFSTKELIRTFMEFKMVLTGHAADLRIIANSTESVALAQKDAYIAANLNYKANMSLGNSLKVIGGLTGVAVTGMMGFSAVSRLAANDAIFLAEAINILTAAFIAFQTFTLVGNIAGVSATAAKLIAGTAFTGSAAYGHSTISRVQMENQAASAQGRQSTGGTSGVTNIVNVNGVTIEDTDDLAVLMVEKFGGDYI